MNGPSLALERPPVCGEESRRADLLAHPFLNGIDWVEYQYRPAATNPHVLVVRMLRHTVPTTAYGLAANPELAVIAGGTRVRGIRALAARRSAADEIEIDVTAQGDYSVYWLALGWRLSPDGFWQHVVPEIDLPFSIAAVNFRPGCPVDFDCATPEVCPPELLPAPALDYQAKDYASFRQLLLDLAAQRNPEWVERNPADLGMTLLELFAYVGDHLSYFQDAVANEAYLDTARQRVSAKRHARLVDYTMHDGRNAWTHVHVQVSAAGVLPVHTMLLTHITRPLRNEPAPPPRAIPTARVDQDAFEADPALRAVRAFETTFPLTTSPANNELQLHGWGNRECCLPRGTTSVYLFTLGPVGAGGTQTAARPPLAAGDYLLLEEVRGPATGDPADADPAHRAVVRLTRVEEEEDPAYSNVLVGGVLQRLAAPGDARLPLLKVTWSREEGLAFPLCLSARRADGTYLAGVSVARGNIVLADDGRTVNDPPVSIPTGPTDPPVRLRLRQPHPLTMQCQPERVDYDPATGVLVTERRTLDCPPRDARPAVALRIDLPTGTELWTAVPTLLDSAPDEQMFVVDVGNDGVATLRFGDGDYGQRPRNALAFRATYRVGNGRAGNVGAEALWHVAVPPAPVGWPVIEALRNPLPARDGTDPETIEEVRQYAPAAFRAEQFRAVTESDYAAAAMKAPGVAGAVAQFRWTGSWYTVFLGIDPARDGDLVTRPGGRSELAPAFEQRVRRFVTRYELAGYDLELRAAAYVPLEIDVELCVLRDHFRADVAEAVRRALSGRAAPDGTRGFFDPARFTFGQPVALSQLYAAIERVQGVDSAVITTFKRYGRPEAGELERGLLPIGPWEIARLDNDPSAMENGVLTVTARGGK